jgi:hypothetical protein
MISVNAKIFLIKIDSFCNYKKENENNVIQLWEM